MEFRIEDRTIIIRTDSIYERDIDSVLLHYVPSSRIRHLLFQDKAVRMDGTALRRGDPLSGDELQIDIYPEDNTGSSGGPVQKIYEDPFIVCVNKPRGILVHTDGSEEKTLSDVVTGCYAGTHIVPYPIHRLDRDTRGLVLFSKTPVFQPLYDSMISEKKIRRTYHAYVKGCFEEGRAIRVDKPIGRDRHVSGRYIVSPTGKPAATVFRGISFDKKKDISLIECTLETGRTHQIRVHLKSLGYGIVNDPLYGSPSDDFIGMGLIAKRIDYMDPFTGKPVIIELDH